MKALLCLLLALTSSYGSFRRVETAPGVNMVEALAVDADGLVWFGTNRGIFCYDGCGTYMVPGAGRTYSMVSDTAARRIYLGTERGLALLEDSYTRVVPQAGGPVGIRSILQDGDSLWLGSFDGLYSWKNGRFTAHPGIRNQIIYSLLDAGNHLYIGTYDGLCSYDKASGQYAGIDIPNPGGRVNVFVNALMLWQEKILVGTEDGLFSYDPSGGTVRQIPLCNNSVKTFATDADGNVLVGTDNGLYVLDAAGMRHIRHEAGREDSLGNDIVWSILCDSASNVWLATDESVSVTRRSVPFVSVRDMTGTGGGNRFTSIICDRSGRLWLGGTDGLICLAGDRAVWHRVDDAEHPLSHNRVRRVYEDSDGDIWLCTDGSIHILRGSRFVRLDLSDSSGFRNANWAYDILEDGRGRMWVASSLGGVLIKDKAALLSGDHIADSLITLPGGNHGQDAWRLAACGGAVYALFYNDGLRSFGAPAAALAFGEPSELLTDGAGRLWTVFPDRLVGGERSYDLPDGGDILCAGAVDGAIWISRQDGLVAVDTLDGDISRVYTDGYTVTSICQAGDRVVLGTRDGIIRCRPQELIIERDSSKCLITAISVDSEDTVLWAGRPVRDAGSFVFSPRQTHLAFVFACVPYREAPSTAIAWRLKGLDEKWNVLPRGDNRVVFNQIKPGRYVLQVGLPDASGQVSSPKEIHFRIRQPWYLRWWAFLLYLLAAAAATVATIHFFRIRNRLQIERIEKNAILDRLASQSAYSASQIDIVDLARRSCDDFRTSLAPGRKLSFTTNTAACQLPLDEYRISTALENILTNAAEHGLGDISVNVDQHGDRVSIEVADQGPGIPPGDLPYVKDRFYRGSNARGHGAGIGLYLADVYVCASGGVLKIDASDVTRVCLQFATTAADSSAAQLPAPDEKFLSDITAIIESRMEDSSFNVASLCDQTGLGTKLVYRKIKQLTGLTPVEYLRTLRLRRAAALLKEKKYTVSEIMYKCGFANSSYFSKCFQAEYGASPKNYNG